jgi:hypothetical protein
MYNVMYMAAQRTQIYLTKEQRSLIDAECERTGASLAEVIRAAIDEHLGRRSNEEYQKVLDQTFGSIPGMPYPDRSEWNRGYG